MAFAATGLSARRALYDLFLTVDLIEDCLRGRSLSAFLEDAALTRLVTDNLVGLGEISSHIDTSVRTLYPELPWPFLASLANSEDSRSFVDDPRLAWALVRQRILPLRDALHAIFERAAEQGVRRFAPQRGDSNLI